MPHALPALLLTAVPPVLLAACPFGPTSFRPPVGQPLPEFVLACALSQAARCHAFCFCQRYTPARKQKITPALVYAVPPLIHPYGLHRSPTPGKPFSQASTFVQLAAGFSPRVPTSSPATTPHPFTWPVLSPATRGLLPSYRLAMATPVYLRTLISVNSRIASSR